MEQSEGNIYRSGLINMIGLLIESVSIHTQFLVRNYIEIVRRFLEVFEIHEFFDAFSDRIAELPPFRFLLFATVMSCAIPIVMFISFGIATLIVTFASFLFIEGTLLAVGGLCLFLCLALVILILTVMTVTSGGLYFMILKLRYVLSRFNTTSTMMRRIAPALVDSQSDQISTLNAHIDQH